MPIRLGLFDKTHNRYYVEFVVEVDEPLIGEFFVIVRDDSMWYVVPTYDVLLNKTSYIFSCDSGHRL